MRAGVFSALFLALLGLAAVAPSGPAAAQPAYGPPAYGRDGIQPLDRLLPGIRRAHPGNFYDAEGPTYGPSGDAHYHLKWMTPDGRVIWFDTDARSGRVLRAAPGRDSFDGGPRRPSGPYVGRYPPYTADPYDRGYGRMRERGAPGFVPPPRYGNPGGEWRGGRGTRWRR